VGRWSATRPECRHHARRDVAPRWVITRAIVTDALTFCPPLVITDEQVDRIVDTLATVAGG
jgi:adenosylmethionine-8-amino-7-oxononanoate aminotransferase